MSTINISGNGHNSTITLYRIHQGQGSFRNDTATTHSQVKIMQEKLTALGYSTQGADGKFGPKTLAAVKKFQKDNGLTQDGYFGKNSLNKLEARLGVTHISPDCENEGTIIRDGGEDGSSGSSGGRDNVGNLSGKTYKTMKATRINNASEAEQKIAAFSGEGTPISVTQYKANLQSMAQDTSIGYTTYKNGVKCDCSGYTYLARNKQGYHGATTNFCEHCKYFGSIADLGKSNLVPGMELYHGYRKTATSPYFYASHVGVYAGKMDLGDGNLVPAVYQSTSSYSTLKRKYNKSSGPDLTALSNNWTYWGWSKYVKGQ